MIDFSQILGFAAIVIGLAGYAPQIIHLIRARCSAGISLRAYVIWLVAAILLLMHAIMIRDAVFIVLQTLGTALDTAILLLTIKNHQNSCDFHSHKI